MSPDTVGPDPIDASAGRTSVVVIGVMRDPRLLTAVDATLHTTQDLRVTLTALRDLAAAKSLSARARFDAILVEDALLDDSDQRQLFAELARRLPALAIGRTTARAADAMRAGARDHVSADDRLSIALPAALRAAISPRPRTGSGNASRKVHGRAVGFVGVSGGVGTTSTLVNCAASLARQGRSVIAAELTPWTSAFAAQLRRSPAASLADLLASPEHIERDIEGYLTPLPCGVRVLFGSRVPRGLTALDAQPLDHVLYALARLADVVLLDLPGRLPETFRQLARHLDQVVLVEDPRPEQADLACAAVDRLEAWGVGKARIGLIQITRSTPVPDRSGPDLASALGIAYLGTIPGATRPLDTAAGRGVPLVVAEPEAPVSAAYAAASLELLAAADHQRLKVALVNASEETARIVSELLDESDPVRFDLLRAVSLDDVLGEVTRGAFHAVLLFTEGRGDDLERDLSRLCGSSEQTAVVVGSVGGGPPLGRALARGAQDVIELVRSNTYWLAHCLVSAIERQRQLHKLRAQQRELENCEVSHRRIIMQLLREAQHDPRMV